MKAPRIVRRAEWGARYDNGAGPAPLPAPGGVVVHHSTDPARNGYESIRALEQVGESRFGAGISYTFPITEDGTIYEGHSVDRKGTHTGGHNSTVRAFCFHGNYMAKKPTPAQLESAAQLLAYGVTQGWWPSTRLRGHRDFKATACPGDMAYPELPGITRRADEILAGHDDPQEFTMDKASAEQVERIVNAALDARFNPDGKGNLLVRVRNSSARNEARLVETVKGIRVLLQGVAKLARPVSPAAADALEARAAKLDERGGAIEADEA